jgi:hypothetical protein
MVRKNALLIAGVMSPAPARHLTQTIVELFQVVLLQNLTCGPGVDKKT